MSEIVLKGDKGFGDIVEKGLGEYFFDAVEKYGDKIFQIDVNGNKTETFKETKRRSLRVALYLRKLGIKHGDIVMPCCENNIDNVIPVLAASFLGATVCSLDTKLDLFDIKYCLNVARPKVVFIVSDKIHILEQALKENDFETHIIVIGENLSRYTNMYDLEKETVIEEEQFKPVKVDVKKDVAAVLFSSGTTNLPKGVMWSSRTLLYWAVSRKKKSEESGDTSLPKAYLHTSGLYWNTNLWGTVFCILHGTPKIILVNPNAEKYFEVIEHFQLNYFFMPAPQLHIFLSATNEIREKYDLSGLRMVAIGGSPIDTEDLLKLRELFPRAIVIQVYGSTELGTTPFVWNANDLSKFYGTKPSSCGTINFDVEAKIVDVLTGDTLGPNKEGEILIKSPHQMLGFYNQEMVNVFDNDGFLKTGDLGYYDEDEFFYVVDRINEIYKYRAHRICPVIIENLLMKQPEIKEAVAFGIPNKIDQYHGAAYIVLNEGFNISEEKIDRLITDHLGDNYRLRAGIKIIKSIPKTPIGKYKRRLVKEMFQKEK